MRCRVHARRHRPLIRARAVPSDHDPRAGHHSAGPGPSGTTSSPPGTAGDALPTLQARACARGAQAVSARRPGGCRRGHRRRLARRTDATRAAAAAAALAGRCVRARLLTTAPALPHAAPAPSHTPHVLHVVVWPMETGASRHLALVHRQHHLGDARVGGPPHVKPEHKPRGAHKHDSEQDYAGFGSGTADGRCDSVRRARTWGCWHCVGVRRGAGVDGIGAARARAGSHRGILRNHCAKKTVACHTARLGRAPLIPWKKVVLRR